MNELLQEVFWAHLVSSITEVRGPEEDGSVGAVYTRIVVNSEPAVCFLGFSGSET